MAQPASRQDLIDYALRQNGAPVLEINVAEEQLQDLICLLYTSPSPRDMSASRMPSSA